MKMMRKNWKDRKGVSPVIATILMVAITVVLAAVLYVMVMGFGGDGAGQAPTVKLTKDGSIYKVSIDKAMELDALKVRIGGSDPVPLAFGDIKGSAITVTLVDAGVDKKLNNGDYFKYVVTVTTTEDTPVDILWTNGDTNQVVASFTVPATTVSGA